MTAKAPHQSTPVEQARVMRHFLLCNAMKNGPFSPAAAMTEAIRSHMNRLAAMSDAEVAAEVHDDHRRERYLRTRWSLETFDLSRCVVWRQMGGRQWAEGSPLWVAEQLRNHDHLDNSRIFAMVNLADVFDQQLQIIITREPGLVRIDDGSHRAVAMALAGRRSVLAFVGARAA